MSNKNKRLDKETLNEDSNVVEDNTSSLMNEGVDAIKRIKTIKLVDIIMAILIVLLVIVILLLRGCNSGDPAHGTVDIPGNIIDPVPPVFVPEASLVFNVENEDENLPFDVEGMVKNSVEHKGYRIVVSYNSNFILKYDMTIRDEEEFQKLAEVLKVKVELDKNILLYDGLLKDMPELEIKLEATSGKIIEYLFDITITLDETFGEEYYNKSIVADMMWWIEGYDELEIANNSFETAEPVIPPVTPPEPTTELNFLEKNENDNVAFDVSSMKDNDIEIKYFGLEIIHDETVELIMDSTPIRDTGLGEILNAKVVLVGGVKDIVLYNGLLDELSIHYTVKENSKGVTDLYLKVVITAPNLTEDYYDTKYKCSLVWSLKDTPCELKIPGNSFVAYKKPYVPPYIPPVTPPVTATSIELTAKEGYDNIPFNVDNMLPGDSISQYYCVTVTHDSKEVVSFSTLVDTNQILNDVLRIKVEHLVADAEDVVLYDGLIKDCSSVDIEISANLDDETVIYYRITVYTNGAEVGNEYAGESLDADFVWQIQ